MCIFAVEEDPPPPYTPGDYFSGSDSLNIAPPIAVPEQHYPPSVSPQRGSYTSPTDDSMTLEHHIDRDTDFIPGESCVVRLPDFNSDSDRLRHTVVIEPPFRQSGNYSRGNSMTANRPSGDLSLGNRQQDLLHGNHRETLSGHPDRDGEESISGAMGGMTL